MKNSPTKTSPEFSTKLERIRGLLEKFNLDALLLQKTGNFSWATCGADSHINTADSMGIASLLITRTEHFLLTNNIEAVRLLQEQGLSRQNWEPLISPWFENNEQIADVTRGMEAGADSGIPWAVDLSSEIASIRSQLTPEEGNRFRTLGTKCASGMYQAVDHVNPGMTEYEIAGLLARYVESQGVQVIVNLVATDERIFSYRHPLPTAKQLQNYAMLVLCGRQGGLICSLTRFVYFGQLPEELRRKSEAVARIDGEMIMATRPGTTLGAVFSRAQKAYASAGFPDEWKLHHQGGSVGYAPREVTATPSSTEPILAGQAFAWNPSITGIKSEDTIVVDEGSADIITEMTGWPVIDIKIGQQIIKRPAILEV